MATVHPKFQYNGQSFEIKINYGYAVTTLREKYGIDLISTFENNNLEQLVMKLSLDDEIPLKLLLDRVKPGLDPTNDTEYNNALEPIDGECMQGFKSALMDAIELFFDPTRRSILRELRKELPKLIQKEMKEALNQALIASDSSAGVFSNTSPKQDSPTPNSTSTP